MKAQPELCTAARCDRMGEALVEQYAPTERFGGMQTNAPTGEWIWLCGPHVAEEFK